MFFDKLKVFTEKENNLALPNELFELLLDWKNEELIKSKHIPFIYSYLYLQSYMYRYSKYSEYVPTVGEIKSTLGLKSDNITVDYIIKKGGILDLKGLTYSANDYPILTKWSDGILNFDRPKFITVKEESNHFSKVFNDDENAVKEAIGHSSYEIAWRNKNKINNNQYCKIPTFAFYRDINEFRYPINYLEVDGTFYESHFTTIIPFTIFEFCMKNEELGCTAFYLYSYLKHKSEIHSGGYDANHIRLSKELGISKNTIIKYRNNLRKYKMLNLEHNMKSLNPNLDSKDRKVSTNIILPFEKFTKEETNYNKLNNSIDNVFFRKIDNSLDHLFM